MSESIAKANMVISGSQYRTNNHNLSVISNGKLDEKAEDERKFLIKSMTKRGTPNAVANRWSAPVEKSLKDELPESSTKKSLEEFEARKSIQLQRKKEYELELKVQKDREEAERRARREAIMRRYSEKAETKTYHKNNGDDDAFLADIEKLEVSKSDYEKLSESGKSAVRRISSSNNSSSRKSISDRASIFEKLEEEAALSSRILQNPSKSRKSSGL